MFILDPKNIRHQDKTVFIHTRSIDDRSYTVQETLTEGKDVPDRDVVTQMTQEEVAKFEEDWSNLWNPQAKPDFD